jgi:hypothetical protein
MNKLTKINKSKCGKSIRRVPTIKQLDLKITLNYHHLQPKHTFRKSIQLYRDKAYNDACRKQQKDAGIRGGLIKGSGYHYDRQYNGNSMDESSEYEMDLDEDEESSEYEMDLDEESSEDEMDLD